MLLHFSFDRRVRRVRDVLSWALLLAVSPVAGWGHGAFHDRVVELQAALAARPDDPALLFDLAVLYAEHGDASLALQLLTRVEQLASDDFPIGLVRGCALRAAGDPAAARAVLDRYLEVHPTDARALLERARALDTLDEATACGADLRAALQGLPDVSLELVQEIAEIFVRHGQRADALEVLETALQRLGAAPGPVLKALELNLALERFDAALHHVDTLRELSPRPESWMAERAAILGRAGRREEAHAAWDALLAHLAALPTLTRGSLELRMLAEHARKSRDALVTLPNS